jgi:maltose-binding protein MalE
MLNLKKDVDVPEETPILWTHRTQPGMDIYFITNQSDEEIQINPEFRVSKDLKPQLWDAVSGEVLHLNEFEQTENGISIPLKLKAEQSWFVVFTNANLNDINAGYQKNFQEPKVIQTLKQPFTVDFNNKEIGPKEPVVFNELTDWSKSADEQIKYYSGTAVYTTSFDVETLPGDGDLFINLGKVSVMAEVKLNGKEAGGVWISPYRVNVSGLIQLGENTLEIEVVNLWRNQMIKDKMLPESERYTWTVVDDIKEGEAAHSSGLLGPVTIEIIN